MRVLSTTLMAALAVPAMAQDAAVDWDLHREDMSRTLMAHTQFSNGLGVGFRCVDGSFAALVSGLPADPAERRMLRLKFGEKDAYDSTWTSTTDNTVAVADLPAPLARDFREGGSLRLTIPGAAEGGRNLTYVVDLPQSSGAIDETLTRCRKPLVDPRDVELEALPDAGLPTGMRWVTRPRIRYPSNRYASGYAVVSCIAGPEGNARDCVIESEHPHDGKFGGAALDAMDTARLAVSPASDGVTRPGRFVFRAGFTMEGPDDDERAPFRSSRMR